MELDSSLDAGQCSAPGRADDGDAERDAWVPDAPDSVDLVVEVAAMMAVFAAQRLERIDGLVQEALADAKRHGLVLTAVIERSVRLELAAALRITEHAAGELMALADAIVRRYPAVLESLSCARMTEDHARVLVGIVDEVEPGLRDAVAARAVELAETSSVGAFRRALRKHVDTVRASTLAERHDVALEARRVVVEQAADGMGWLHAYLPAVELHAAFGRLTALAKVLAAQEGETRTLDQLRADVFGDLVIDGEAAAYPAEARGIRATVAVTVPVLSLLDGAGHLAAGEPGRTAAGEPAVVEGIGPIPMTRARELCGGAEGWMRILTHPETGMVLSVGRDKYKPPASLRRLVKWRADRCMAPGCGVPAARCEIDHQLAWEHGGHTALSNLTPFCKGHHIVKHHGGWDVRQVPGTGGTIEWTSPTGRRYLVQPERAVPVFRTTEHEGGDRSGAARPPF